eukprot:2315382-Prymnesium_polylepis.3
MGVRDDRFRRFGRAEGRGPRGARRVRFNSPIVVGEGGGSRCGVRVRWRRPVSRQVEGELHRRALAAAGAAARLRVLDAVDVLRLDSFSRAEGPARATAAVVRGGARTSDRMRAFRRSWVRAPLWPPLVLHRRHRPLLAPVDRRRVGRRARLDAGGRERRRVVLGAAELGELGGGVVGQVVERHVPALGALVVRAVVREDNALGPRKGRLTRGALVRAVGLAVADDVVVEGNVLLVHL